MDTSMDTELGSFLLSKQAATLNLKSAGRLVKQMLIKHPVRPNTSSPCSLDQTGAPRA